MLDNALKWCIKHKAKCLDELQDVESIKVRLDKIRDTIVQEKNEAAAAEASSSVTSTTGDQPNAEAAEDEVIQLANPAKYSEHGTEYWQAFAAQTVKTYVKLIPEPRTVPGVADAISLSEVNKCKGIEQKSAFLVLLDVDLLCESTTRPSDRRPVLPDGLVQGLLRGSMQGRGAQNKDGLYYQPISGDVYFLLDGKREHLHKSLLEAFCPLGKKAPECSVRVFNLFLSEQSLRARKAIVRGSDPISQRQCMLSVSPNALVPDTIPEKPHSKYHGTNRGDVIGLINLHSLDGSWQLTFEKKKVLYGDRLVACDTQDKDPRSQRRDDSLEPVFYNHMPDVFYQNLFLTMSAVGVLDLSAGPGEAAKAALVTKRPYLGLCLTEQHVSLLYRHLVHWALGEMATEGTPLYNAKYAEHVGKATAGGNKGAGQGGAKADAKAGAKAGLPKDEAKDKAKKQKPRQKKQKRDDESGSSGEESSEPLEKSKAKKKGQGKKKRKISSSEEDSHSD